MLFKKKDKWFKDLFSRMIIKSQKLIKFNFDINLIIDNEINGYARSDAKNKKVYINTINSNNTSKRRIEAIMCHEIGHVINNMVQNDYDFQLVNDEIIADWFACKIGYKKIILKGRRKEYKKELGNEYVQLFSNLEDIENIRNNGIPWYNKFIEHKLELKV